MERHEIAKGMGLTLMGSLAKCGNTIFVRYAGENSVDVFEVLFMRSLFQFLLFRLLVLCIKVSVIPPIGTRIHCFGFVILNTLSTLCAYHAFSLIVPGLAVLSNRAARTLFTILFTFLFTTDVLGFWELIAIFFCLVGIGFGVASALLFPSRDFVPVVVLQSLAKEPALVNVLGFTLVILAGMFKAMSMVVVRRNKDKLHSFLLVLYQAAFTMPVMCVLVAYFSQRASFPNWKGGCFIMAVCATSSLATWTSSRSVQLAPPTVVALIQNLDIFMGLAMDIGFMSTMPNWLELVGAGMILVGVVSVTLARLVLSSKGEDGNDNQDMKRKDPPEDTAREPLLE